MIEKTFPDPNEAVAYGFLLLTHTICADQQIHSQESRALRDLAAQVNINEATLQEMEKILGQDDNHLTLEDAAQNVPEEERQEVLRQVLAIAYIDGYFSPLEREVVNEIARIWGIDYQDIEQMLEDAQGFSQWRTRTDIPDEDDDGLSIGARLLKGAESVLSRSLVTKLAELAPDHLGQQIERLQREILLSGPEYDEAIQQCAKVAGEDYKYAEQALSQSSQALKALGNNLQNSLNSIKQKTTEQGDREEAKKIADQLGQTRRELLAEILHELEVMREALRAKERALNHFSIAFMGRTKAGKSTLHAVITGEGWNAIGIGKQRTTRYNRVYEWKNIRIIDTPGIGAPGGKTDEEIARSVIEEADVICYVVTDDSVQESEFEFLKVLKEKTKPLVILLNIQYNLRDSRRLEHFLTNPDRWFAMDGKSGIGGHLNRIHRYAQNHYPNDYMTVVPVMLLAAQLAQEPKHEKHSKQLFKASRIQDFLDSIRASLIDYGAIRRSQTLLGSTVGSIDKPQQWISQQAAVYNDLATQLQEKRQSLNRQLQKAELDSWNKLQQEVKNIFQDARDAVSSFAEDYWDANGDRLRSGWNRKLKGIKFEERLKTANENAAQDFQREVREAIEEIGNELKIIANLKGISFNLFEQDTDDSVRQGIKIGGNLLSAACLSLALIPGFGTPFVIAGIVFGALSTIGGFLKSRKQKRREAVHNISTALMQQLEKQEGDILFQSQKNFEEYCQAVAENVDIYFKELIQGIGAIASQLKSAQGKLANAANYLNRAYAKRIIDWATDQPESLTDIAISKKIRKVNRDFGRSIQIQTATVLPPTKTQDEICTVLQERVTIQPTKR